MNRTPTAALLIGDARRAARPSNLGLSSDSVAYRSHAPVVMIHRDSDTLARSNFEVIRTDLEDRFPEDVTVETFRDWAYGWTEHVLVRVERPGQGRELPRVPTDAWLEAVAWLDRLEDYPVADEEHWSALEEEELLEYVTGELRDADGYLEEVLERLSGAGVFRVEDLGADVLEEILEEIYAAHVDPLLEQGHAYLSLRSVGDGQLTFTGDVVRVPAPPALEDVELYLEDRLPWAIATAVEESDRYASLLELRDVLAGVLAVA